MIDWSFDAWPAIGPEWAYGCRKTHADDHTEFHVDLGCGNIKKGRIGVDRFAAPGVNVVMDLDTGIVYDMAKAPGAEALLDCPDYQWGRQLTQPRRGMAHFGLPFDDSTIQSVVTHHCFEHLGEGFIPLMDDIYRVLVPGGLLRVIVPLFPSHSAVGDQDHKRWFMEDSFDAFCGTPGATPQNCWLAGFSVPYTGARFEKGDVYAEALDPDVPAFEQHRELRVSLRAQK